MGKQVPGGSDARRGRQDPAHDPYYIFREEAATTSAEGPHLATREAGVAVAATFTKRHQSTYPIMLSIVVEIFIGLYCIYRRCSF
jgi:hypothetical protein